MPMRQGTHLPQESPFEIEERFGDLDHTDLIIDGGEKPRLFFVVDVLPVGPFRIDGKMIEQNPPANERFMENVRNIPGMDSQVEEPF